MISFSCSDTLWPSVDRTNALRSDNHKHLSKEVEEDDDDINVEEKAMMWAEKYCMQSSLTADLTVTQGIGKLAMHNSSHPCYKRARFRILMGFMRRRIQQPGKIVDCYIPDYFSLFFTFHYIFLLIVVWSSSVYRQGSVGRM